MNLFDLVASNWIIRYSWCFSLVIRPLRCTFLGMCVKEPNPCTFDCSLTRLYASSRVQAYDYQ